MFKYLAIPAIILSYFLIDAPLVHFIHENGINKFFGIKLLTHIPDLIIAFLFLYFIFFVLFYKKFSRVKIFNVFFLSLCSVAISAHLKDFLKFVFGRYWPDTWIDNNPSLLVNNAYGFHFFQKGSAFQSFPSGHTTVTFAFFIVLMYFYPKHKRMLMVPGVVLAASQVLMHYHFLSDVIAGALLGWLVATVLCHFFANKMNNV